MQKNCFDAKALRCKGAKKVKYSLAEKGEEDQLLAILSLQRGRFLPFSSSPFVSCKCCNNASLFGLKPTTDREARLKPAHGLLLIFDTTSSSWWQSIVVVIILITTVSDIPLRQDYRGQVLSGNSAPEGAPHDESTLTSLAPVSVPPWFKKENQLLRYRPRGVGRAGVCAGAGAGARVGGLGCSMVTLPPSRGTSSTQVWPA